MNMMQNLLSALKSSPAPQLAEILATNTNSRLDVLGGNFPKQPYTPDYGSPTSDLKSDWYKVDSIFRGLSTQPALSSSNDLCVSKINPENTTPLIAKHRRVLLRNTSDTAVGSYTPSYRPPGRLNRITTIDPTFVRGTHPRSIFCLTKTGDALLEKIGGYNELARFFKPQNENATELNTNANHSRLFRINIAGQEKILKIPGDQKQSSLLGSTQVVPSDYYIDSFGHASAIAEISNQVAANYALFNAVPVHIAGLQLPRAGLPENSFKRPAFMIMDIGPDITLGDLKEHFEPTQFIRSGKTNPPNQKVVAYVLEHGIRFEDYKKLENIILRSELFANALVYGAPAYSDLHCDYNYDNFLIREFKDSSWKVDVIDQVDVNTLYVRDVPSPDEESETAMCKFAFYTEFSAFMKKQMPHLDFRHNFQMPESLHPPAYYLSHNTYGIQSDWFMEKRRYFTDRIKQLFSEND